MYEALALVAGGMNNYGAYSDTNNAIGGLGLGGFYIDQWYILLVIPALIIALIAQVRAKSAYNKYSKIANSRGMTGAQAARMILDDHGLTYIPINISQGTLSDHFDPRNNTVNLSPDVYSGTSIASIGIAAHEVGHAIQHAEHYFPNKVRSAVIPVTNFGSNISMLLILAGLFLPAFVWLAWIGVALYSTVAIFQLVTLPVEFNASHRAMDHIKRLGIANDTDAKGVKKVLSAAAMTYVAALITSLASFLRIFLIVSGSSRRRN